MTLLYYDVYSVSPLGMTGRLGVADIFQNTVATKQDETIINAVSVEKKGKTYDRTKQSTKGHPLSNRLHVSRRV